MGMDAQQQPSLHQRLLHRRSVCIWLTVLAALAGLALIVQESFANSTTYDEVTYLRVAAHWWRTGEQAEITRMGSPLLFWKLQQTPVLWLLDRLDYGAWVDDPIGYQEQLLPWMRVSSCWIWLVAFGITVAWSNRSYGLRAMALAAWLFALSPNLLAHGALITMEIPLVASIVAMFYLFWRFLETNRFLWFCATAGAGGFAFSCKFTTILILPILATVWWVACYLRGERKTITLTMRITVAMIGFLLILLLVDAIVTGFASLTLSTSRGHHPTINKWFGREGNKLVARIYETPIPQDWVGFAAQLHHQTSGGPSYLLGACRMQGWWYYYLVAVAVKVPLIFWVLVGARLILPGRSRNVAALRDYNTLLPLVFLLYMGITAVCSTRNYGVRYLLPLAPLAIVWISAIGKPLHEDCSKAGSIMRWVALSGVAGYAVAVAGIHPYELTYFNAIAGGPLGGRRVLADSNLDWGQGLRSLARLQRKQPELVDMTLYYFGDTQPAHYGVVGESHVINATSGDLKLTSLNLVQTRYLAVSASLEWGPWGPPGFFNCLKGISPVVLTDDTTIAIYNTADLRLIRNNLASGAASLQ